MPTAKRDQKAAAYDWTVRRQSDVQSFFRLRSRASVDNWIRLGMPGGRKGPWDLSEIAAWRDLQRGESGPQPDDSRARKLAAEAERAEHKNRLAKLDLAERESRMADVAEISQRWNMGLLRIKHRLEAAPEEMAMRFPEATRTENVNEFADYIFRLLKEMSEMEPLPKGESHGRT